MIPRINNQKGETLVSILIGIFILSIAIFGISNLLANNLAIEDDQFRAAKIRLMELNATNIIKQIDTSGLAEKEVFYLEKNSGASTFKIHTGSLAENYAYINFYGEPITNTGSYTGGLYLRTFIVDQADTTFKNKNQIIKGTIRELLKKAP